MRGSAKVQANKILIHSFKRIQPQITSYS